MAIRRQGLPPFGRSPGPPEGSKVTSPSRVYTRAWPAPRHPTLQLVALPPLPWSGRFRTSSTRATRPWLHPVENTCRMFDVAAQYEALRQRDAAFDVVVVDAVKMSGT